MNPQDLGAIAKEIIDANIYMVLGTADKSGQPWVTPVYFSCVAHREFYWISSPEVQHSRNIAVRPQISIVVFDSHASIGTGQAVYMSATAEELTGINFDRGLDIYNGRFSNPADHGVRLITSEDVQAPSLYRLYRAIALEHWILDPASPPDHRTLVII
ncbi:MAG TPA: pyridoxamine 5'-phosphate oxidase family protein [Anaerolineales bacterium]|nr:pyridoxamine 5'-phosphate oxidase family protein [Anaerolineales bacterium]